MEKQIKEITDTGAWLEPDCFRLNIRNYFVQSTIERLELLGFHCSPWELQLCGLIVGHFLPVTGAAGASREVSSLCL